MRGRLGISLSGHIGTDLSLKCSQPESGRAVWLAEVGEHCIRQMSLEGWSRGSVAAWCWQLEPVGGSVTGKISAPGDANGAVSSVSSDLTVLAGLSRSHIGTVQTP